MSHFHIPTKRLGGFYFAYYAAIGVLVPYLSLYLKARGLSAAEIGSTFGLLALTRIIAPYLWGVAADKLGQVAVVLLSLGAALSCFMLVPFMHQTTTIIAMITFYGMMVNGTMAQFEVLTFAHLAQAHSNYARIRLWGSIGFLVLVMGLGPVLDYTGLLSLPYWIGGFFIVAWFIAQRIPEPPSQQTQIAQSPRDSAMKISLQPSVLALLICCLLAQVSFGPYYGFYSLYLEAHSYSKTITGGLWALGVMAEVAIFWFIPRYLPRLSLARLFMLSQLVTAIRWALLPLSIHSLFAIAGVALLHAISFGVYHLAAVNLIQRHFSGGLQGRGQAIYIGMSYGVGGAIGGWGAGQLWAKINPDYIWFIAAAIALVSTAIAQWKVRDVFAKPVQI